MSRIPFDIKWKPQIESGEYKVETRDGKKVRVLCYDANNIVPVVALVTFNDGSEGSRDYYLNGTMDYDRENPLDLFVITPEEELTEFEQQVENLLNLAIPEGHARTTIKNTKRVAAELLPLAREQFIKDGYIIEKKAFHDAVEKVSPEVMKEVSENVIVSSFIADLGKRYPEVSFAKLARIAKAAYDFGEAEAMKDFPRWRTIEEVTEKRTDDNDCVTTETMLISESNRNHYGIVGPECMVNRKTLCIPVVELSKLPGFKEE